MAGKLPLYRGAAEHAALHLAPKGERVWTGNVGLWYDKFCDRWRPDLKGFPEPRNNETGAKQEWVDSLIYPRNADSLPDRSKAPVKTGHPALLAEMAARRERLAQGSGGRVLRFTLTSRLLTGLGRRHPMENGVAWHHSLGVPYLAGSAVKGLLRTAAERAPGGEVVASDLLNQLFGPRLESGTAGELHRGALQILDALPISPVQMVAEVITPHTGAWNLADPAARDFSMDDAPADWHSPNPITFAAVEGGAIFQFVILPGTAAKLNGKGEGKDDWQALLNRAVDWLDLALTSLGAGAKTVSGYGRFVRLDNNGRFTDPDVSLPPRPPGSRPASTGPRSKTGPTLPKRGTVDGDPVEILKREDDCYVVKFLDTGDIERVRVDEVT